MTLHSTWYTNSYLKGQTIDNIVVIIYVNIYKHTEKSFEHVSSTVNTFPQLDNYWGKQLVHPHGKPIAKPEKLLQSIVAGECKSDMEGRMGTMS